MTFEINEQGTIFYKSLIHLSERRTLKFIRVKQNREFLFLFLH